jgi:DNA polymerase-3 subunit alpha
MPKLGDAEQRSRLLGFYLSGHPLADYHGLDEAVATFATPPDRMSSTARAPHGPDCGILGNLEKKISKKDNRPWCLFTVSSAT